MRQSIGITPIRPAFVVDTGAEMRWYWVERIGHIAFRPRKAGMNLNVSLRILTHSAWRL